MVSVHVPIIVKCRASDQDQSLIPNKKLNKPLGFQSKSAAQTYSMEEKVTSRTNPHRIPACISNRDHRYKVYVYTDIYQQFNCPQLLSQLDTRWCPVYQVGTGNLNTKQPCSVNHTVLFGRWDPALLRLKVSLHSRVLCCTDVANCWPFPLLQLTIN